MFPRFHVPIIPKCSAGRWLNSVVQRVEVIVVLCSFKDHMTLQVFFQFCLNVICFGCNDFVLSLRLQYVWKSNF